MHELLAIWHLDRSWACEAAPRVVSFPIQSCLFWQTTYLCTLRLTWHQRSPRMVGSRFLPGRFASAVDAGSLRRRLSAV